MLVHGLWMLMPIASALAAEPTKPDPCGYDRKAMLALDQQAFDQDLSGEGGGWRRIAGIPGCALAAADLLRDYRDHHKVSGGLMAWHEGQMRANAGQYAQAIPLLDSARKPAEADFEGWNLYVDATLAFLRRDLVALNAARASLLALPYPKDKGHPPLKDGYLEIEIGNGQPPMKVRWPLNIDVVDGLVRCFDKPYQIAYGSAQCRTPAPAN